MPFGIVVIIGAVAFGAERMFNAPPWVVTVPVPAGRINCDDTHPC